MAVIKTKKDFEEVIKELNTALKIRYEDFEGISFYGSRTRDDYTLDSDFDIVVLFSSILDWRKENDVLDLIYEFELKYDIVIDVKVYRSDEIKKQNTPFRETVYRQGIFYGI